MAADKPASGAALWRLNRAGLLGEALERSPDGVIGQPVALELVNRWFAEHPEERKPRNAKRATKRPRGRERPDEQKPRKARPGRSGQKADPSVSAARAARMADPDPVRAELAAMSASQLLKEVNRLEHRRRRRS